MIDDRSEEGRSVELNCSQCLLVCCYYPLYAHAERVRRVTILEIYINQNTMKNLQRFVYPRFNTD